MNVILIHQYKKSFTTTLVLSLTLVGLCELAIPAHAQMVVGPPSPRPKQEQAGMSSKVVKMFKDHFEKSDKTEASEGNTGSTETTKAEATPPAEKAPVTPPPRPERPPLISAPSEPQAKIEAPIVDEEDPPAIQRVKLDDPTNPLGLADAHDKLKQVHQMITADKLMEARRIIIPLRQWLVESTEAHINIYQALNKVPSARTQAQLEKQLALEFALLRDTSLYELGRLYAAEKDYKKAVKELTEVIKSQPRSQLGIEAYGLLQEIGFTEKIQLAQ